MNTAAPSHYDDDEIQHYVKATNDGLKSADSGHFHFTELALPDLKNIRNHIGDKNLAPANQVVIQIVAACDRLV